MKKSIDATIMKYETYIENIQWHIDTNIPTGSDLEKCELRILDFKRIISDLISILTQSCKK